MKFLHTADLHLGKIVNGFSMLEDQKYILKEILRLAEEEQPDGVLLAGDIYDRQVPSAEAVDLFDDFLVALAAQGRQVFVISGNHDSAERLSFGGRLMDAKGVHIAPVFAGEITPITLEDAFGKVNIYLLPFVKPAHVRRFFPEAEIETITDAIRAVLDSISLPEEERNILVAHQFVAGAQSSDSEETPVGGELPVDPAIFAPFDYVALGHLHRAQSAGAEHIRYSGTPLKYAFSEANHEKSVTILELKEKGERMIRTVSLHPRRDLKEIRGTYEELVQKSFYEHTSLPEDYVHITLTNEENVLNAVSRLRVVYPYLMKLDYDNIRTRHKETTEVQDTPEKMDPLELFASFYEQQNGQALSAQQNAYVTDLIQRIWGEDL